MTFMILIEIMMVIDHGFHGDDQLDGGYDFMLKIIMMTSR